jgi:hypothetical protein
MLLRGIFMTYANSAQARPAQAKLLSMQGKLNYEFNHITADFVEIIKEIEQLEATNLEQSMKLDATVEKIQAELHKIQLEKHVFPKHNSSKKSHKKLKPEFSE